MHWCTVYCKPYSYGLDKYASSPERESVHIQGIAWPSQGATRETTIQAARELYIQAHLSDRFLVCAFEMPNEIDVSPK